MFISAVSFHLENYDLDRAKNYIGVSKGVLTWYNAFFVKANINFTISQSYDSFLKLLSTVLYYLVKQ